MCVVLGPAAMFAVSLGTKVLSAGMSYIGQQQQAKQQQAYYNQQVAYQQQLADQQNQYILENAKRANKAYIDQASQENLRLQQEEAKASQETIEAQIEAREAAGQALAASQSASQASLHHIYGRNARFTDTVQQNLEWERQQAFANLRGYRSEALNRINSVRPYTPKPVQPPSRGPSIAGAIANVATGALGSYNRYLST